MQHLTFLPWYYTSIGWNDDREHSGEAEPCAHCRAQAQLAVAYYGNLKEADSTVHHSRSLDRNEKTEIGLFQKFATSQPQVGTTGMLQYLYLSY
jgi:hypothetical protein